jgi:hypothetical protein
MMKKCKFALISAIKSYSSIPFPITFNLISFFLVLRAFILRSNNEQCQHSSFFSLGHGNWKYELSSTIDHPLPCSIAPRLIHPMSSQSQHYSFHCCKQYHWHPSYSAPPRAVGFPSNFLFIPPTIFPCPPFCSSLPQCGMNGIGHMSPPLLWIELDLMGLSVL